MADGEHGHPANWCVHYRYNRDARKPEDDTCKAGVRFDTFAGSKFHTRPCFLDDFGRSKPGAVPCASLRRPTAEEITANELEWERQFNLLGVVQRGIKPWREAHQKQNFAEVIECPVCKGRLHLSIAACNGHVHGKCETDGCAEWMERDR